MTRKEIAVSKSHSLTKFYQEFGESTSMHGIGRVISNNSMWKRVVWSIITLLGFGFAVYQFVTTINDFYSYPVTTLVTLNHETKAMFPGITICNLNRKRKSRIGSDLLKAMSGLPEADGTPFDTFFNVMLQNTMIHYNQSGHQISDMLTRCLFNRLPCWKFNFSETDTATYGTCYTFHTEHPELQFITRPGQQNGLILELNIQQDEYLPITTKAGVKVIVHPPDEYPFPEDGGILAHPGVVTSIGIKKVVTHRLPAPYSTCVGKDGQGSSQRSLFPDKKYTQTACMKSCFQLTLFEKCHCCDVDLPCDYYNILNVDKTTTKPDRILPLCNDSKELTCKIIIQDLFLKNELNCDELCPSACDRTTFETVVSAALWPPDSRFEAIVDMLNNTFLQNNSFTDSSSLERFFRSNILRLEIFLDSFEFLEFTTQAKYDWNLLLGTVGGLLGLWLGFSLLTAVEIVEVLIDTVLYCISRKHKKKTTTQTETN